MAKKKDEAAASQESVVHDLVQSLLGSAKDRASSSKGYLLGDHAQHTYGIELPSLAMQYLAGLTNVLPLQRWYAVSGLPKSMKSTFQIMICMWYAMANGCARYIDAEEKASYTMFEAMTWWRFLSPSDPYTDSQGNFCAYNSSIPRDPETGMPEDMDHPEREILLRVNPDPMIQTGRSRLIYTPVTSIEGWQTALVETLEWARDMVVKHPELKEKGKRVPIYCAVDSLTGKDSEAGAAAIEKEGHAQERGYGGATRANMISSFLRSISMRGTCMSAGYVQHLSNVIADGSFEAKFADKHKEAGGDFAKFAASLGLRLDKQAHDELAFHPAAPFQGPPVTRTTVVFKSNCSSLGPDKLKVKVDVLWQFPRLPDGSTKQVMVYDWEGALGEMLWTCKYGRDTEKGSKYEIGVLDEAVYFTQVRAGFVKCEELCTPEELAEADKDKRGVMSMHEFGKRIEASPKHRKAVQHYLCINKYPTVQEADIDWSLPDKPEPKGKK
jgi:hypothetical protein